MREVGCELVEEMQITKTATTEAVRNANSPTASARSTNGWHTDSRFGFLPTTSERWDLEWNSSVFVSEIVPSHPGLRLDAFPDPPSPPVTEPARLDGPKRRATCVKHRLQLLTRRAVVM
jgi:hypothetical protein